MDVSSGVHREVIAGDTVIIDTTRAWRVRLNRTAAMSLSSNYFSSRSRRFAPAAVSDRFAEPRGTAHRSVDIASLCEHGPRFVCAPAFSGSIASTRISSRDARLIWPRLTRFTARFVRALICVGSRSRCSLGISNSFAHPALPSQHERQVIVLIASSASSRARRRYDSASE